MSLLKHMQSLGENDPLILAMIKDAGGDNLRDVVDKMEALDAQADQASFLNYPETRSIEQTDEPTVCGFDASHETPAVVGDYRLTREIGHGGFGRVFAGYHHIDPQRKVAVKIFENRWLDEISRLDIEKLVLQKLRHPNLVRAIDSGTEPDGTTYLVMNLVEGIRIDQYVQQNQIGFPQIAQLFGQIAAAMEYAHEQDVVHRDLKPANILITNDGVPVVTDFGLAKRLNLRGEKSLTATGLLLGTLGYLAPEQADPHRREVTRSVDVYGLGATLYHILTGHAPFERENLLKALDELRTQSPVLPNQLKPGIPSDLERVCLKCLAKSPHDRYESMNALANDLQRFIDGKPVAARPLNWNQRLWRWCLSNPVVGGLSIGLAVAVLSGLVASTFFWRQAVNQQQITAALLVEAVKLSQADDQAAEKMLEQTPDTLEFRYQRLLNSVQFLDGALKQFPDDDNLFRESATSYFRLGKVCCRQGKFEEGLLAYDSAFTRFQELADSHPDDHTLQFDVFHSLLGLDQIDRELLGLPAAAEGKMTEAFEIIQQLVATNTENTDYRDALICMQNMVYSRRFPLDSPKILELYEATYLDALILKAKFPNACLQWRHVGGTAFRIVSTHVLRGELQEAEKWLKIAFEEIGAFIKRPDLDPGELMDWAECLALARKLEFKKGNLELADDYARQWTEFVEASAAKYPDYHVFRDALARADEHIGQEN